MIKTLLLILAFATPSSADTAVAPYLAEGVKVGEVSDSSAIIWTRICGAEACDSDHRLPGTAGQVRVRFRQPEQPDRLTPWVNVDSTKDYTTQLELTNLTSGATYHYTVEAQNEAGRTEVNGKFNTAPDSTSERDVRFVVTTGHKYSTAEQRKLGPHIYPAMLEIVPDFFVHTGDVVYYDNDTKPSATDQTLARLHWHRMYSLERRVNFHLQTSSYFIKDDHDLLKNDCWPGQKYGELTFEQGVRLFNEQTPSGVLPYRTFRWGKHLQIWLMEGREFRSPNTADDGPDKTIWGAKQWEWIQQEIEDSNATFKILLSPTPIVGPDRKNKSDNHANKAFAYEGKLVRKFLSAQPNTFVLCGDRHWQYESVDTETGLTEYSCGPSTDKHAGGWNAKAVKREHRFLRVAGGFLSAEVTAEPTPKLTVRLHDVTGKVVYKSEKTAMPIDAR